ncbi:hypothetical protein GCM10027026_37170 [Myroides odoratimimus subsp. xuanwuensis]
MWEVTVSCWEYDASRRRAPYVVRARHSGRPDLVSDILLMGDPRVSGTPVRECGEALVDVRTVPDLRLAALKVDESGAYAHLRSSLVTRLLERRPCSPTTTGCSSSRATARTPCSGTTSTATAVSSWSTTPTSSPRRVTGWPAATCRLPGSPRTSAARPST